MFAELHSAMIGSALLLAIVSLIGCASEDRRLVADEETCRSMGHVEGTPEFKQCMTELNLRRCATRKATKQGGKLHEAATECERLGTP